MHPALVKEKTRRSKKNYCFERMPFVICRKALCVCVCDAFIRVDNAMERNGSRLCFSFVCSNFLFRFCFTVTSFSFLCIDACNQLPCGRVSWRMGHMGWKRFSVLPEYLRFVRKHLHSSNSIKAQWIEHIFGRSTWMNDHWNGILTEIDVAFAGECNKTRQALNCINEKNSRITEGD